MRYAAAAAVLGIVDAYPITANNYRIYHDTRIGKLVFFPSGVDRCDFTGVTLEQDFAMVARLLIETPRGRETYLAAVDHVLASAYDAPALVRRIESLRQMLAPVVRECHPQIADAWDVNFWIRDAILKRPQEIRAQLERARARPASR